MRFNNGILGFAAMATLALSACGGGDEVPKLMNTRSQTRSPDEFTVLPSKPLTMPEDLAVLPEPTPGGTNITDPTPEADTYAALGGNPEAATPGKISPSNSTLIGYASRFGTAPDIRQTLAVEDLEFRRDHNGRLLERWFNVNVYYKAYASLSLDQYAELERWRAAGVRTESAPPEGYEAQ